MPDRRVLAGVCLVAAVLVGTACGDVVDPSQNIVENFSDTLPVGGLRGHEFSVSKNGEFEVKITALSEPDSTIALQYGLIQGGGCGILQANFGRLNQVVLGGLINAGRYCLSVSDPGTIPRPATYTIRVSHP